MISRIAVALAIAGLSIAVFFIFKGPAVSTPATALTWGRGPLDAGAIEVQFSRSGVDFIWARDAADPFLSFNALRRGEQVLVLEESNFFHLAEQHEGGLWALAEREIEGPGPSIDLLNSEDEGRTFARRALPKPNYQAAFKSWSVRGDELTLVLWLDDETGLSAPWAWSWWPTAPAFQRTVGPGQLVLRSKNGGRSWRLER